MRTVVFLALAAGCSDSAQGTLADGAQRVACDVSVPLDQLTVQAGVDATPDGGTLCVDPGTWVGAVVVDMRDVAIVGAGPDPTVLDGGGIGSTITVQSSTLSLVDVTVTGGKGTDGGGLAVYDSTVDLAGVTVVRNRATTRGGGIYALNATLTATSTRVVDNRAAQTGGGLALGFVTFNADDLTVAGNVSDESGGGGMAAELGSTVISNSSFVGNASYGAFAQGGGAELNTAGSFIENVLFAGNFSEGEGGGVTVSGYGQEHLTNVVIARNRANDGGGVRSAFWGNNLVLSNSVVAENQAALGVGGILTYGAFELTYSDLWGNSGLAVSNNQPDPVGTNGNIAVDPLFVALKGRKASGWDLHLQPGSLLIDAGDPALLDPDGTISDIGLYGGPGAL